MRRHLALATNESRPTNKLRYHRLTPPSALAPRPSVLPYMNLPQSTMATSSRALAIALTVFLFVAGSFPAAGQGFPGVTHWIAHLASYAVIAFAYGLGWQKQPAILVAGFVAALGAIHEYSEIVTHDHALEIADVLVNSIGAAIGVELERALVPATVRA